MMSEGGVQSFIFFGFIFFSRGNDDEFLLGLGRCLSCVRGQKTTAIVLPPRRQALRRESKRTSGSGCWRVCSFVCVSARALAGCTVLCRCRQVNHPAAPPAPPAAPAPTAPSPPVSPPPSWHQPCVLLRLCRGEVLVAVLCRASVDVGLRVGVDDEDVDEEGDASSVDAAGEYVGWAEPRG